MDVDSPVRFTDRTGSRFSVWKDDETRDRILPIFGGGTTRCDGRPVDVPAPSVPDTKSLDHEESMKKGIHPNYREVVFQDTSCGFRFLTKSTVRTNQTTKWEDGKEYPLFVLDISSASHPFYTGAGNRFVDAAGRIDRFNKRFGNNYGSKKKKTAE